MLRVTSSSLKAFIKDSEGHTLAMSADFQYGDEATRKAILGLYEEFVRLHNDAHAVTARDVRREGNPSA